LEVLQVVSDIWASPLDFERTESMRHCWRFGLLKAMAYLFAGAEIKHISRLDNRATGVVAKLCLLSASMLGESVDSTTAAKFHLLDIDGSCIPNRAGIVLCGQQTAPERKDLKEDKSMKLNALILTGCPEDFTVHIEPDWHVERDTCLIAYRDRGRIVHRLSPASVDAAMAIQEPKYRDQGEMNESGQHNQHSSSEVEGKFHIIPIAEFHGSYVVTRQDGDIWEKPFLVPTRGRPKARACIKTLAFESVGWMDKSPRNKLQLNDLLEGSVVLYDDKAKAIVLP